MKKRTGFTLIEMIGVLAILSILAAMIAPAIVDQIFRARLDSEEASLQTITDGLRSYYIDNNGVLPATLAPLSPTYVPYSAAEVAQNDFSYNRMYEKDVDGTGENWPDVRTTVASHARGTVYSFAACEGAAEESTTPCIAGSALGNADLDLKISNLNLTPERDRIRQKNEAYIKNQINAAGACSIGSPQPVAQDIWGGAITFPDGPWNYPAEVTVRSNGPLGTSNIRFEACP